MYVTYPNGILYYLCLWHVLTTSDRVETIIICNELVVCNFKGAGQKCNPIIIKSQCVFDHSALSDPKQLKHLQLSFEVLINFNFFLSCILLSLFSLAANKPVSPYGGYSGQLRSCVYQPTELALITKSLANVSGFYPIHWLKHSYHYHTSVILQEIHTETNRFLILYVCVSSLQRDQSHETGLPRATAPPLNQSSSSLPHSLVPLPTTGLSPAVSVSTSLPSYTTVYASMVFLLSSFPF